MLERLSVQHFLLLDDVDLVFHAGFNVLTGETGAGKSLLMGALDLCLGGRAESNLVRSPYDAATLTAVFMEPPQDLVLWMHEQGIVCDDIVILKRVIAQQGKSRAFINNQPVTLSALRIAGAYLIQIHGQFDALLDPSRSLDLVDAYGLLDVDQAQVRQKFETWHHAIQCERVEQERHRNHHAVLGQKQEFLTILQDLDPQPDEEALLLSQREDLRYKIKKAEYDHHAQELLEQPISCVQRLQEVQRVFDKRAMTDAEAHKLSELIQEALVSLAEVECILSHRTDDEDDLLKRLHHGDERLSALRDAARRLGCAVDGLFSLKETLESECDALDPHQLGQYRQAVEEAERAYMLYAQGLSLKRQSAAQQLTHDVTSLCSALRLNHTHFSVVITPDREPSSGGLDQAVFMVSTNPGFPLAPLDRVASGGERSRLMLALRTVLSEKASTPTLIFDEIDSGMSGTVAHTVGAHMAHMAQGRQVISITHAPQVAAQADHHIRLLKSYASDVSLTQVRELTFEERVEEIARMMAGASITPETRVLAEQMVRSHIQGLKSPSSV